MKLADVGPTVYRPSAAVAGRSPEALLEEINNLPWDSVTIDSLSSLMGYSQSLLGEVGLLVGSPPATPASPPAAPLTTAPAIPRGPIFEEAQPPTRDLTPYPGPTLMDSIAARFSRDPLASLRLELKAIEHYEKEFQGLREPAQFQAHTARLRDLLRSGDSLKEIRPQAYALARVAASVFLSKRPFDSQMLGALAMEKGNIAQMGTGEGKTLTALMPLFLNALAGKGSHLVTVNDYLAQSGYQELKPVLEALGTSTGLVLKDMQPTDKRAAYAADVTYVSNDTLGFDFLEDRRVDHPHDRVQREPFFALLDEADQVLLDEAQVPLIIAELEERPPALAQGKFFAELVKQLRPGQDFLVERKERNVFLTEIGQEIVANEVGLAQLSTDDPDCAKKLAAGLELRTLLRGQPQSSERKAELLKVFPGANIYLEENHDLVFCLQNALEAHGLFRQGRDYAVENGEVQIIDEFKGRISEGRRFTQGLHQALEIKEGLEARPETRTAASITYPNLFRGYPSVAGMTGTAETASRELTETLGLTPVAIPPNRERQRIDHPDAVFATQEEKFVAITARVRQAFEEGIPVLVSTRSVEMNHYVSTLLTQQGIPNQSLSAQDVKSNTAQENSIIATAGQSGVVTVATNMAGRGVDIKPDALNFKELAIACDEARGRGEAVVVILEQAEQVERLKSWFQISADPSQHVPFVLAEEGAAAAPGTVLISTTRPTTGEATVIQGNDFPGKKLLVVATERNMDRRIDDQLRGRAGRQGAPGETQFFVSLEDELMRGYSHRDRLLPLVAKNSPKLHKLVDQAQEAMENLYADSRLATAKFDKVDNQQRQALWKFRDQWVDSRPDVVPPGQAPLDVVATVKDWIVERCTDEVSKELGDERKPSSQSLNRAVSAVAERLQIPLQIEAGATPWQQRVKSSLANLLDSAQPTMLWQAALSRLDEGWTEQLGVLEEEKQNSNLEAYCEKTPEQVYAQRAFTAFEEMWKRVKGETTAFVLRQLGKGFITP